MNKPSTLNEKVIFFGGIGATAGSYYQKAKILSKKEEFDG